MTKSETLNSPSSPVCVRACVCMRARLNFCRKKKLYVTLSALPLNSRQVFLPECFSLPKKEEIKVYLQDSMVKFVQNARSSTERTLHRRRSVTFSKLRILAFFSLSDTAAKTKVMCQHKFSMKKSSGYFYRILNTHSTLSRTSFQIKNNSFTEKFPASN